MSTHLVNDPFDAVDEMLDGIVGSNADRVALTISGRGLYSTVRPPVRRVAIVAGGGSGHEPGFLGWVGPGFADGVAVGNIFASPSAEPVLEIVHELRPEAGVLFLFGNYEGDIMNFGLASAILADEGVATRTVLLTDDVASAPPDHIERRRGVAGGVIVHKIVGALADEGASLDDVAEVARAANAATRSIGVALSPCHLPTATRPTFVVPEGEVEFGVGIHGESGLARRALGTANDIADQLVDALLADLSALASDRVIVIVNSFGATPLMEAYILLARARQRFAAAGANVVCAHAGQYLTSLQMAGVSISATSLTDQFERLLMAPAEPLYLPRLGGSR